MIELTQEELKQRFNDKIFGQISETADALGLECYVVGGYVRDIFLERPSKDVDVVVVGSGIERRKHWQTWQRCSCGTFQEFWYCAGEVSRH